MIEAGAGLVVGTVTADGVPRADRAWSATVVDPTERRVRFVMSADDPVSVGNLFPTASICLTGADVRTLRSVQLKGRVESIDPPSEDDLAITRVHTDAFLDAIHRTDGDELDVIRRFVSSDVVVVEMVVEEMFDQSPGPTAGDPLPDTHD